MYLLEGWHFLNACVFQAEKRFNTSFHSGFLAPEEGFWLRFNTFQHSMLLDFCLKTCQNLQVISIQLFHCVWLAGKMNRFYVDPRDSLIPSSIFRFLLTESVMKAKRFSHNFFADSSDPVGATDNCLMVSTSNKTICSLSWICKK